MTEYGRGQGSEPWPPEDPLYGDGGWGGQQPQAGHQPAHGGQQHPQQPHQQSQYGDWNGQQGYDPAQAQYDQQQYGQQYAGGQYQGGHQQYPEQLQQQHGEQQYPPAGRQQYGDQQQYAHQGQQVYQQGGWDGTGTHAHVPYAADPGDPYGQQPAAYGAEQPDLYGTQDAYPPPEPPGRRGAEPEPEAEQPAATDWDPGPDRGEHAFFAGGGDTVADTDDDADDEPGGTGRRGRGGKGDKSKKRRNGCACLVVLLVFGGGLAGVSYVGYTFYQNRYGSAPDYAGDGTGQTVSIEVPKGAGGAEIGRRLKEAGVVKSVDAFVSAFTHNPEGDKIQAGAYILEKQMSAASAVEMMLDPKSQANVMVKPGQRNVQVYQAIDDKLGLSAGTTKGVARKEYADLGLPAWAKGGALVKDPLEGFLYPGTYAAAKGMKPEAILKEMVRQADAAYAKYDLTAKAKQFKLDSPLQVVTVASLVQAEGKTIDDYRKMAEVVYNRLDYSNPETYGFLQFDSTYNYVKNQSNIDISLSEIKQNKDPYNTYSHKGLPPGPIGNPGETALKATLDPTHDGWYYFVATDGVSKTEFARTHADFEKLRDKFNARSDG
ncbi:endolytic transglycosylase MltG [Streptomyces galbus]|uniref:Endolytic murein transglycosylase n=1 Tax=Streptomyces galbus TaxID=33898 RepID=A0ABX1IHG5_STRGB|nr:endolytic transglycosylase MltG [Streptomyces galbus]NKQ25070.1 endolytic transglycosylase MltG [Streptomyces galbus]